MSAREMLLLLIAGAADKLLSEVEVERLPLNARETAGDLKRLLGDLESIVEAPS